jgi:hypothetical protein
MWYFFSILCLAVFLFIAIVLIYFIFRFRSILGSLGANRTPAEVTLQNASSMEWKNKKKLQEFTQEVEGKGFRLLGHYRVEEMPGLALAAWSHPQKYFVAIAYEHPMVGFWYDAVVLYTDGTDCTVTNSSMSANIDSPEWKKKVIVGKEVLYPAALERLSQEIDPSKSVFLLNAQNFVPLFCAAYDREMEWRALRGTTLTEVQAIGAEKYTEEETLAALPMIKEQDKMLLEDILLIRLRRKLNLTKQQLEDLDLVVIHERLTFEEIESFFEEMEEERLHEYNTARQHSTNTLEYFQELNIIQSSGEKFECYNSVDQPIHASFFRKSTVT